MNEARIRAEIYNLLARLWYWPITQTDARVPLSSNVKTLLNAIEKEAPSLRASTLKLRAELKINTPPIGRPDILCLNPTGPSIVVECKVFPRPRGGVWTRTGFNTRAITAEQRRWLNAWTSDGGGAYLALGTLHGKAGSKTNSRLAWLIPWVEYKDVELRVISCGASTIPLAPSPKMRLALRDAKLYATAAFSRFELIWRDGHWHVSPDHPLYRDERELNAFKEIWSG